MPLDAQPPPRNLCDRWVRMLDLVHDAVPDLKCEVGVQMRFADKESVPLHVCVQLPFDIGAERFVGEKEGNGRDDNDGDEADRRPTQNFPHMILEYGQEAASAMHLRDYVSSEKE